MSGCHRVSPKEASANESVLRFSHTNGGSVTLHFRGQRVLALRFGLINDGFEYFRSLVFSWPELSPRGGKIVDGRICVWAFCLPKRTLPYAFPTYPTSQWLFVEVQRIPRLPYKRIPRQHTPSYFLIDLHSDAAGAGIAQLTKWDSSSYTLKLVVGPEH